MKDDKKDDKKPVVVKKPTGYATVEVLYDVKFEDSEGDQYNYLLNEEEARTLYAALESRFSI